MNLYLISQTHNRSYDTYSDAVVAARTVEEAAVMHPGGGTILSEPFPTWVDDAKLVTVKYLGEAAQGTKRSVICASFHAG